MAPQQLWQMQPQDYMPDTMPKTKTVTSTVVPRKAIDPDPNSTVRVYGGDYGDGTIRTISPEGYGLDNNTNQHLANRTTAHEAGHAMYQQDLSPQQQSDWANIHKTILSSNSRYLEAVSKYPGDPSHSFAEAFGEYATEPQNMQKNNPDAYNYFKTLTGFEYSRKRIK